MDDQLNMNILKLKKDLYDILKENDKSKLENYNQLIKILMEDSNKRIAMLENFKSELDELFEKSSDIKSATNKLVATQIIIMTHTDIRFNAKYKAEITFQTKVRDAALGKIRYQINITNIPEKDFVNISENIYHVTFSIDANYKLLVEFIDDNTIVTGKILCQKR